jgi:hypothetical protein
MTVEELLAQHQELITEQDLLQQKLRELLDKLRATRTELWIRNVVPWVE